MKQVLFSLAFDGLRKRKKSSFLLFMVLFLCFAGSILSLSLTESLEKTNELCRYDTYGKWEGAVLDADSRELDFLEETRMVDRLGTARCYGIIAGNKGIGTVDETLWELGHLGFNSGRLPENAGEIVVEADVLSALGYSYDLGQEIQLTVSVPGTWRNTGEQEGQVPPIPVTETYVLCGVLKEYSNLWEAGQYTPLNSALLTEEGAEKLLAEAETQQELIQPQPPSVHCFFTLADTPVSELHEINANLTYDQLLNTKKEVLVNVYAYPEIQKITHTQMFHWMIFLVSLTAIVCIYLLQVRRQVYQIALFRSIGITRGQMRRLVYCETWILGLPAAVLGGIAGALGTWGMVFLFTGKRGHLSLQIPVPQLVLFFFLWLTVIGAVRMLVLQTALRQPLTGRFQMGRKKGKAVYRVKAGFLLLLSAAFAGVFLFLLLEAIPLFGRKSSEQQSPSYRFYGLQDYFAKVSEEELSQIEKVPGIDRCIASNQQYAELSFDGMESNRLYEKVKENTEDTQPVLSETTDASGNRIVTPYPDGVGVYIYGIKPEDLPELPELEDMDWNAFQEGSQVLVVFPADENGKITYGGETFEDTGLEPGSQVHLAFYGSPEENPEERKKSKKKDSVVGEFDARVGKVIKADLGEQYKNSILSGLSHYMVLCSYEKLKDILEAMEPGYELSRYRTGEKVGYNDVDFYTTEDAGYLSTDFVMADLSKSFGMDFRNMREQVAASVQQAERELLLLVFGCGCILLILALALWDILAMDREEEKRKTGLLRALGMSKRQVIQKGLRQSCGTAGISLLLGGLFYSCYFLVGAWKTKEYLAREFQEVRSFFQVIKENMSTFIIYGVNGMVLLGISMSAFVLLCLLLYLPKAGLKNANFFEQEEKGR